MGTLFYQILLFRKHKVKGHNSACENMWKLCSSLCLCKPSTCQLTLSFKRGPYVPCCFLMYKLLALDTGVHSVWDTHFSKFLYFVLLYGVWNCISLDFVLLSLWTILRFQLKNPFWTKAQVGAFQVDQRYYKCRNIFPTPLPLKQKCSTSSNLSHSRFQAIDLCLSCMPYKFITNSDLSPDSGQIPRKQQKVNSINGLCA